MEVVTDISSFKFTSGGNNGSSLLDRNFSFSTNINPYFKGFWTILAEQIGIYGSLTVAPFGFLLNIVSLVVFYQCKTHKTATGLYLMCIAVADNLLILGMITFRSPLWKAHINIPDFLNMNSVSCKGVGFLIWFAFLWSGMLLASATVERFISIAFALKVKSWNLLRISKMLILFYLVICVSLIGTWTYTLDLVQYGRFSMCIGKPSHYALFNLLNTLIFTIISNGICAGIILLSTILIAIFLFSYKRKRNEMRQNNTDDQSNKEFKISLMLFAVACFFIIFRFPGIVILEIRQYYQSRNIYNNELYNNTAIVSSISDVLTIINHSVNFFIYIIFFKAFRKTVLKLFKCKFSVTEENQRKPNLSIKSTTVTAASSGVINSRSIVPGQGTG